MIEKDFLNNLTIVIDSREQKPYTFPGYKTVVQGMSIGDYGLQNCTDIAVERKNVDDLIGSLTKGRDRLQKELQKGSHLPYFALVIEASLSDLANGNYQSSMLPNSAVQTLLSWSVKHNTHIFFCDNREYAEQITLSLLLKYGRMLYQKYNCWQKLIVNHIN
jgi:ERCC4-type nuclease